MHKTFNRWNPTKNKIDNQCYKKNQEWLTVKLVTIPTETLKSDMEATSKVLPRSVQKYLGAKTRQNQREIAHQDIKEKRF